MKEKYVYNYGENFELLSKVFRQLSTSIISDNLDDICTSNSKYQVIDNDTIEINYDYCNNGPVSDKDYKIDLIIKFDPETYSIIDVHKQVYDIFDIKCEESGLYSIEKHSFNGFDIYGYKFMVNESKYPELKDIPLYTISVDINKATSNNKIMSAIFDQLPYDRLNVISKIKELLDINLAPFKFKEGYHISYDEIKFGVTPEIITGRTITSKNPVSAINFEVYNEYDEEVVNIIIQVTRDNENNIIDTKLINCDIVSGSLSFGHYNVYAYYNTTIQPGENTNVYVVQERSLVIDNTSKLKSLQLISGKIDSDDLDNIINSVLDQKVNKSNNIGILSSNKVKNKFTVVNFKQLAYNDDNIIVKSVATKTSDDNDTHIIMSMNEIYTKCNDKVHRNVNFNPLDGLLSYYDIDIPTDYQLTEVSYQDNGEFVASFPMIDFPLPGIKRYYYSKGIKLEEYSIVFPKSGKRLQQTKKYYQLTLVDEDNGIEIYKSSLSESNYDNTNYYLKIVTEKSYESRISNTQNPDQEVIDIVENKISEYKEKFDLN